MPRFSEVLKTLRTVPGILVLLALMPRWFKEHQKVAAANKQGLWIVTLVCSICGLTVIMASLFVLTPNSIFFASYIQPLAVAAFLGMIPYLIDPAPEQTLSTHDPSQELLYRTLLKSPTRLACLAFLALAAIGSIRAIGMSTWGLACAADFSYPKTIERLSSEMDSCPPQSAIVLSSPYLYEAARHFRVRSYHSDWLAPAHRGGANMDLEALVTLKPCKIILTQFDYFRRFDNVLAELKNRPEVSHFEMVDTVTTPAPDSFPALQKIVQHISWAPVIVSLTWK